MDITPQLLKEVKFSDAFRGYDRDEVDEFLERVGAGVALVQGRLRDAVERAEAAEARASMGGRSEAEETLKRTLVLAQRTADAAVAEANETAQRTVAEAEARAQRAIADADAYAHRTVSESDAQAHRTISDAETQSTALRAEAEAEARRVIESTRAPLLEEIAELERIRNFLRDDVALLEDHLRAQRDRLRAQIDDLAKSLDEPDMLRPEPTPETSGIDPSAELSSRIEILPPAAEVTAPPLAPQPAPIEAAPAAVEPVAAPAAVEPPVAPEAPSSGTPVSDTGPSAVTGWAEPADHEPSGFDSTDPVDPWRDAPPVAQRPSKSVWDDPGPATQPVQSLADLESGGDSFLDQLRRAVDDDTDEDRAMTAFFDQDDDDRPKPRFGRRR